MKKSFFLLTLVGLLSTQATATPTGARKTKFPKATVERQLANFIAYPDALKLTQRAGVVVIPFRVNTDSELCQVTVFSQNKPINASLIKYMIVSRLFQFSSIRLA